MQLTDFPTQTDFSRVIILTNLNKTDDFGMHLYLLSAGFHSDLFTRTLHFFYYEVKIANGKMLPISQHSKPFSDATKQRQYINNDGSPKFENGEPVMIGVFSFWEKGLGFGYIYPDLQETLDGIGETYPN